LYSQLIPNVDIIFVVVFLFCLDTLHISPLNARIDNFSSYGVKP